MLDAQEILSQGYDGNGVEEEAGNAPRDHAVIVVEQEFLHIFTSVYCDVVPEDVDESLYF